MYKVLKSCMLQEPSAQLNNLLGIPILGYNGPSAFKDEHLWVFFPLGFLMLFHFAVLLFSPAATCL